MNRERRMLAVEDDNVAARVLREVARGLDLGFVRAGSARLARLAFRPLGFAVAVVDLGLPEDESASAADADGFDVIRRMLALDPGLPVVAWSARVDDDRIARARALGARLVDKNHGIAGVRLACAAAVARAR